MQAIIKRMVSAALAVVVAGALLATAGSGVAWALPDCTIDPLAVCQGTLFDDDFEGEDDVSDPVGGARDVMYGSTGSDGASGNRGNDRILGGFGRDGDFAVNNGLDGDRGNDFVDGGKAGDYWIIGDAGKDTVLGGRGSDEYLSGGDGIDHVDAGSGNDVEVSGNAGRDHVYGGPGDDGDNGTADGALEGGSGNHDYVHGGPGDDLIDANNSFAGDVEDVFGDEDNDTIVADDGVLDNIDCGAGNNDTVTFDAATDTVDPNCENQFPV
jgi:hypothetical protein